MSGKMLVLFAKSTRHVMSAVTVTAVPATQVTADALVGTALQLRNAPEKNPAGEWRLALPAEALDVTVVNADDQVLADPFSYEIGSDKQPRQLTHPTEKLTIAAVLPASLKVTVSGPLPLPSGLNVLVCEEHGADAAKIQPTTMENGVATVTTTVTVPRIVLALVAGYPPAVTSV